MADWAAAIAVRTCWLVDEVGFGERMVEKKGDESGEGSRAGGRVIAGGTEIVGVG